MKRPLVKSKSTALGLGAVFLVAGCVLVYDGWEGRGGKTPWFLGPVLPW